MFYEGNTLVGGTPNTIALEGFWRTPNENNWRYLADIYIYYTAQRVLISNASTLENSTTLREIQIPSAWADDGKTNGSIITAEVNQGGFADGQDVWLYVFDQYGTPSDQNSGVSGTQGYHIQFAGNSGDNVAPSTPSGLSVN